MQAARSTHVRFHDISQQGACIECEKWLAMNELVRLDTGVMPSLYAKVRWRDHPRYGLVFEQTFKLDELARISAPLQLSQALTEAAAPGRSPSQPARPRQPQNGPSQTGRGRIPPCDRANDPAIMTAPARTASPVPIHFLSSHSITNPNGRAWNG
jgi:hypothetical protein